MSESCGGAISEMSSRSPRKVPGSLVRHPALSKLFTELTGDRKPLHFDLDLARRSRFGGIVVQGGVATGLLNALVAEDLPEPGSVFLQVNWRFLAPVRPGDVITAEARVWRSGRTSP